MKRIICGLLLPCILFVSCNLPQWYEMPDNAVAVVQVEKLINTYKENQVAADENYTDKVIVLIGKVERVSTGILGTYVTVVQDASKTNLFASVICTFSDTSGLGKLSVGDTVAIAGTANKGLFRTVSLNNCRLVGKK